MKILTILGTRPEIIRLSRVIPKLDEAVGRENHILLNTGQNSDPSLNGNFFTELGIRQPGIQLGMRGSFAEQLSRLFPRLETILDTRQPDRVLILGDTNTALAAIVAARAGIPVYHMEAGNRSFSPRSPEEVNRRLVDHASTVLLPYTERSRQNLLAEGIHSSRVFVTGNPIWEVIQHYAVQWQQSDVLARLGVEAGKFFLVTLHREENVDDESRLRQFIVAFDALSHKYTIPVIVGTHPRTRTKLEGIRHLLGCFDTRFLPPFSFFDFLQLQSQAFCALSDSGTVQEECCLLHRPMVCLRDYTERPECVEVGASALSGADPVRILALVEQAVAQRPAWTIPNEYVRPNVADTVVRILTGHYERGVA
jgi:UDP-N-acetylglucosamine 2-epimerase (non-hydrolysing)